MATNKGLRHRLVKHAAWKRIKRLAADAYTDPAVARDAAKGFRKVLDEAHTLRHLTRSVRVDGRDFQLVTSPGFPSHAWDLWIRNELHRVHPINDHTEGLLLAIVAMTKKCPLRCAHCFEWDALNKKETLGIGDVLHMIRKFQERGVAQIELSGGEPLNRLEDLLTILRECDDRASDLWILTSGYGLTRERAGLLKEAGLTGASISVDHWDAAAHDTFRGVKGTHERARMAVQHAREAGLVTAMSLVPLRSFCNMEDLLRYADLAKAWGVHFIRLVEPRAVGHFADKEVELDEPHHDVLDEFVRVLHRDRRYRDHPVVDHYASYQRNVGCSGSGKRFVYVDTDGQIHACPFCQKPCGSVLEKPLDELYANLEEAGGCHVHRTV